MTTTAARPATPTAPVPERHRGTRRAALALITLLAAAGYGWSAGTVALEPYYAAAVRSMAGDWHAFGFGAFDPDATITLDKLPGAFWLQALSVRAFGLHTWAIVVPQVVAGAATVPLLYRAVRRLSGPAAGLVAALVLAVSPAVIALDRGNISDTVMILLLVAAADAVSGAVVSGGRWRLLLAGLWVGLAFQAKMIEAWLALPPFALAVLLAAPGRPGRRVLDTASGGVVAGVVSLLWMTVVSLLPPGTRPWVDGSTGDSPFEQVFVYNGFGRVGQASPLQVLAGQGLRLGTPDPGPGWARLLAGPLGRDTGWLLPTAVAVAVIGVLVLRRRPRTDPLRAAYLLWGSWVLVFVVAFSVLSTINSYYTAALAPAVAALLGTGLVHAWGHRTEVPVRVLVAVLVALTAGYAAFLVLTAGRAAPGWLVPVVAVVTVAALVLVGLSRSPAAPVGRAGFVLALAAVLVVPAAASVSLVARGQGAFDTPYEPARFSAGVDATFVAIPRQVAGLLPGLERARAGAPVLLAVQSGAVASVFAYPSGQEVLPIGGFTGTGPTPTLDELRGDVATGRFHLVLAFPSRDPRLVWIATHCRHVDRSTPPFQDFFCVPADATT